MSLQDSGCSPAYDFFYYSFYFGFMNESIQAALDHVYFKWESVLSFVADWWFTCFQITNKITHWHGFFCVCSALVIFET